MPVLRFDHVGAVVQDLDEAVRFFLALGFVEEGRMEVGGGWVDRVLGLEGVRSEIVMMRPPGSGGPALELSRFLDGGPVGSPEALPADAYGFRHVAFLVSDVAATVEAARQAGYAPVADVVDYEDVYRLTYLRGPEGLIVEVAEALRPTD